MARRGSSQPSRRGAMLWAGLVRAAALLLLLWVGGLMLFVLRQAPPAPAALRTDGIAVLTGGPGRVARGAQLLRAGAARRLLVSGVDRRVRPAELRETTGLDRRLFGCCVDLGFAADDTRSNAAEVAQWAARHRLRSIRLVTAGYHMPRARAEIAARLPAGVTILADGVPAGLPPWRLAGEYTKFLVARLILLLGKPD